MQEIIWHGRGGKRVVIAAQVLAQAAYLQGFIRVTSAPAFLRSKPKQTGYRL
jgi:Pyruvate/2-oxoacid:ferredoxin oxidoreductase gamma subunit